MSQPPYVLASQPSISSGYPQALRNPPFIVQQSVPYISATATNLSFASNGTGTVSAQTSFRAPAHKHAHHLHSIPPREKSTRTLIIDHMLWVHGRTRFSQARAELGMTDRTGGPSSPNYVHRMRPENYEEEDEENSEGEDVVKLKARAGAPDHSHSDDEDDRLRTQNLSLARNLRLRAEGLEKVVTSMLEQPPPIHPINDEDIWTPPTSPKINPSNQRNPSHPHTLPNGVRLRLALGTIINDLFARQAPRPPYRHHHLHPKPSSLENSSASSSLSYSSPTLPPALTALSTVCVARSEIFSPSVGNLSGIPFTGHISPPTLNPTPQRILPMPSSRTRSLYMAGADPSTANSPPAFRCPRHLHTGCEICVEAKTGARPGAGGVRPRSTSFGGDLRGGQSSSWRGSPGGVGPGVSGGGISGWQDGSGIGSGLLRSGVRGSVLRQKVNGQDISNDSIAPSGAGNTKLSVLIPRFIRLSALVAAELGSEARDEEEESVSTRSREDRTDSIPENSEGWENIQVRQEQEGDFSPLPGPMSPSTTQVMSQAQNRMVEYALQPTREWYMLLSGLLTRAVLEGYLTAGWRGLEPAECLLTVGLGVIDTTEQESESEEESGFEEFDPDELPSLQEAVKLLFPGSRTVTPFSKSLAEEEYGAEMFERLRRFYDILASTPDLSTHMEDLAWQYPTEPIERAAVRFCEAIAKWRGKPELETYKKKPPKPSEFSETSGRSTMTIESLVHSNPTSPTTGNVIPPTNLPARIRRKPSIDVYFTQPNFREGTWNLSKRTLSPDDGRVGATKRVRE